MKIKLIIWDLDGTLVNSLSKSIKNFTDTINPYLKKKVLKREIYEKYLGPTEEQDILKLAVSKGIDSSKLVLLQKCFIKIKQENLDKIKMFKDMDKIILYAKEKGIKQVLITGRDINAAKRIIENKYTKIKGRYVTDYFDGFICGDEYSGKLNAFQLMQKKFSVESDKILVLGDEVKDIEVARKLGYIEGACLWGSFVKIELKNLKPSNLFKNPLELFKYIKS